MSVQTTEDIQDRINNEYKFYCNEIKPKIDLVEVYYGAVPDALLNEIRNFIGHISNAAIQNEDTIQFRIKNIDAAHTHLRRILLDCYKLMCIHQQDYIKEFNRKFKYYNISDVDDGKFLITLKNLFDSANNAFKDAKNADSTGKNEKDPNELGDVYEKYCVAYNKYCETVQYINDHFDGVLRIAHKHVLGKVIAVLGWIITCVLAILTLIPN